VTIEGLAIHRPIHVLHRKGKHLSPLARRFLAFAHEFVAREGHISGPVLVAPSRDKQSSDEAV
jgi:hypothetical protein